MSLGRLLAAGKSLIGGREHAGRYRVNRRVALPKFISPRNPFARATSAGPLPQPPGATQEDPIPKPIGGAAATCDLGRASRNELPASMAGRAAHWLGAWGQKLNPVPRLLKQPGPARSALPRSADSPLQPELSLDQVKVLRNDLSDADLEVVPLRAAVAAPETRPGEKFAMAGNAWDRLTTKFFGAGPT